MQHNERFAQYERNLAAFCRTNHPGFISKENIPGARPDRLSAYRRLVFNGIHENLTNAYPIAAATLGEQQWDKLVESFFAEHDCPSPQLWKMPFQLIEYEKVHGIGEALGRPYLHDLLRFEWAEIEVHMMKDVSYPIAPLPTGIMVNPYHQVLEFTYPVFRIRGDELTSQLGEYYLLIYRRIDNCTVHFIELTREYSELFLNWAQRETFERPPHDSSGEDFIAVLEREGALI